MIATPPLSPRARAPAAAALLLLSLALLSVSFRAWPPLLQGGDGRANSTRARLFDAGFLFAKTDVKTNVKTTVGVGDKPAQLALEYAKSVSGKAHGKGQGRRRPAWRRQKGYSYGAAAASYYSAGSYGAGYYDGGSRLGVRAVPPPEKERGLAATSSAATSSAARRPLADSALASADAAAATDASGAAARDFDGFFTLMEVKVETNVPVTVGVGDKAAAAAIASASKESGGPPVSVSVAPKIAFTGSSKTCSCNACDGTPCSPGAGNSAHRCSRCGPSTPACYGDSSSPAGRGACFFVGEPNLEGGLCDCP
ncbi:hypothetical protein EMIHUDRAFT_243546 [Emiliania huxleyi CCMP1516]|uniref:Uncharacterized protein n=2 Tax=Emiliania huxleyi TaxID=2903 RepID=A0A0D3J5B8_EMIH1|nr:hypothetical protein EMIHUDRAFT_243546 [Emiliania huxleyi CCMP1516]EOD18703.1 hypothetical protein EMIHUDRAFT_243546 [Emiliania huxleyi CCMP1516]|eukprot:XP_005771132.1 hypothetical protein EMIHUDRAFT_243546 [Emiliania huxleyi CCMP1516]